MSMSEVARVRQRIEAECEALHRAMYAPARVASHEMINNRYRRLETYRGQLGQLIGEQQATAVVVETYNRIV